MKKISINKPIKFYDDSNRNDDYIMAKILYSNNEVCLCEGINSYDANDKKIIGKNIELGNSKVWIDLESGVRTNNEFDLIKVEEILNKALSFISR